MCSSPASSIGKIAIAFVLSVLFHAGARGQDYTNPYSGYPSDQMSQIGSNPFESDEYDDEDGPRDSTKVKIRKPLESYFFDDSTRNMFNFAWRVDMYRNKIKPLVIDTMLMNSQIDYPWYVKGVGDAIQGNLGGASVPLNYFDRARYSNFNFAQAFDTYFFFPDNVEFYNVKAPFTRFNYYWAGQKRKGEENFRINHAQNISPSTGFNIDYKSRGTRGIYEWQKGRAKDLSAAFSHTGKKYSIQAGYIYNTINNKENGGIQDDRFITDTIFELSQNVPVNLSDARNVIKNNSYYVIQSYGIPLRGLTEEDFSIADRSSIFFGHALEYHRWTKIYSDTRASSGDFYDNWYINPTITQDSIFESNLSNRLFVQLQPWDRDGIVGIIDAGAGMDVHKYYMFLPSDYLSANMDGINKTEYYVYGSVEGKFRQYFDWGGDVKIHPVGYRNGDLSVGGHAAVNATIKGIPLSLSGRFSYDLKSADYWSSHYFSNHYSWSNSFSKENETRIELSFTMPSIALEITAAQSVINNKIYYGPQSRPTQYGGSVSVSGLYARKDFRFGGFHLNHRVLLQWSTSQEVIPVPLASAFAAYYFEFNVVRGVLRAQLGVDCRYNTKYYAFGYNPAVTAFYNQREKEIGGYPLMDAFVSAKWKRMRILVKMQHLNDDLFGGRNYFSVLHYPQNQRVLKLGFSWNFYD